jgi:hypothetical protein
VDPGRRANGIGGFAKGCLGRARDAIPRDPRLSQAPRFKGGVSDIRGRCVSRTRPARDWSQTPSRISNGRKHPLAKLRNFHGIRRGASPSRPLADSEPRDPRFKGGDHLRRAHAPGPAGPADLNPRVDPGLTTDESRDSRTRPTRDVRGAHGPRSRDPRLSRDSRFKGVDVPLHTRPTRIQNRGTRDSKGGFASRARPTQDWSQTQRSSGPGSRGPEFRGAEIRDSEGWTPVAHTAHPRFKGGSER